MKLYRFFTFTVLQNKRLLTSWSFILVLLIIPVFAFGMKLFFRQESGVYNVALCAEDSNDALAEKIIERIEKSDSVLHFSVYTDKNQAAESVKSGKNDAAWIFMPDLQNKIREYCSKKNRQEPFVRILQRDESVTANLSHEKLYGAVFPEITYYVFENYITENFAELEINREEIVELYNAGNQNGRLVEYKYLESGNSSAGGNYLSSSVRGLLAVVTVVCGLAAQTVFLTDKKRGAYAWMSEGRQIFAGISTTFAAAFDGAVVTFISLLLSDGSVSPLKEALSALCLAVVSTVFCVLVGSVISSPKTLGICIPFITLSLLLLSPIFFNFYKIRKIQMLFPVYYYLNTFHENSYFALALLYSAAVLVFAIIFDVFKRRVAGKKRATARF